MIVLEKTLLKWSEPAFFRYRTFRWWSWAIRLLLLLPLPVLAYATASGRGTEVLASVATGLFLGLLFLGTWDASRSAFITEQDVRIGPRFTTDMVAHAVWPVSTIQRAELFREHQHELASTHPVMLVHGRYQKPEIIGLPDEKALNAVATTLVSLGVTVVLHEGQ